MRAIPENRLAPLPPFTCRQAGKSQFWSAWARATLEMSATQGRCQRGSPTLLSCCLILYRTSVPLVVSVLEWSHAPCSVCEVLRQGLAAGALDVEDVQLHAFVNLVFEPWASVCHCPLLTTAGSEHARNRRHLCRSIICSPLSKSICQSLARLLKCHPLQHQSLFISQAATSEGLQTHVKKKVKTTYPAKPKVSSSWARS